MPSRRSRARSLAIASDSLLWLQASSLAGPSMINSRPVIDENSPAPTSAIKVTLTPLGTPTSVRRAVVVAAVAPPWTPLLCALRCRREVPPSFPDLAGVEATMSMICAGRKLGRTCTSVFRNKLSATWLKSSFFSNSGNEKPKRADTRT